MGCAGSTAVGQQGDETNPAPGADAKRITFSAETQPGTDSDAAAAAIKAAAANEKVVRCRRASAENELEAMEEGLDFALSSEDEQDDDDSPSNVPRARHPSTRNKDRTERASFEHLPEMPDHLLGAINDLGDTTPQRAVQAA